MLPVTALSSLIYCPKQFYSTYVLKEKITLNKAMVMGSIKHKAFEIFYSKEKTITTTITKNENTHLKIKEYFASALRKSVIANKQALRIVNITLEEAYKQALPTTQKEAENRAKIINILTSKGLIGEELWNSLNPKIKTEIKLTSEILGLKGRADHVEFYTDSLIPIELKSGTPPETGVWNHHRIQASAYAILFNEIYKTNCKKAIVHYIDTGKKQDIIINPYLKDWVLETIKKAEEIIKTEKIPKGCEKKNCPYCSRTNLKIQKP